MEISSGDNRRSAGATFLDRGETWQRASIGVPFYCLLHASSKFGRGLSRPRAASARNSRRIFRDKQIHSRQNAATGFVSCLRGTLFRSVRTGARARARATISVFSSPSSSASYRVDVGTWMCLRSQSFPRFKSSAKLSRDGFGRSSSF